jgi:hypothetical protein
VSYRGFDLVCDGCGLVRSTQDESGRQCSWAYVLEAAPGWTMWICSDQRRDYCPPCRSLGEAKHGDPRPLAESWRGWAGGGGRVLVCGELNPYGADPRTALYHLPRGASGDRLRRILGLRDCEYAGLLDKVNLCQGRWSDDEAAGRAVTCLESQQHEVMVLLGARVRRAFGGPAPFEWSVVRRKLLVGLPHPSGMCRVWNDPRSVRRARSLVDALIRGLPWGTAADRLQDTQDAKCQSSTP